MSTFPTLTDADDGDLAHPMVDEADMILPSHGGPPAIGFDGQEYSSQDEAAEFAPATGGSKPVLPRDGIALPNRPLLRRDGSVPAPRQPPPPTPPPQLPDGSGPQDSLSLQQLRRLVHEFPKVEPAPYAFTYQDAASIAEELREWFSYSIEERARIAKAQSSFSQEWGMYNNSTFVEDSAYEGGAFDWINTSPARRKEFLENLVEGLDEVDLDKRLRRLEALVYIVLGCWYETAGLPGLPNSGETWHDTSGDERPPSRTTTDSAYEESRVQTEWVTLNTTMLLECKGVKPVLEMVKSTCEREWYVDNLLIRLRLTSVQSLLYAHKSDTTTIQKEAEQRETWCSLTLMYVCLEVARACDDKDKSLSIRSDLCKKIWEQFRDSAYCL
jgi:hypothetical protein